jgi:hypothetical protein
MGSVLSGDMALWTEWSEAPAQAQEPYGRSSVLATARAPDLICINSSLSCWQGLLLHGLMDRHLTKVKCCK